MNYIQGEYPIPFYLHGVGTENAGHDSCIKHRGILPANTILYTPSTPYPTSTTFTYTYLHPPTFSFTSEIGAIL